MAPLAIARAKSLSRMLYMVPASVRKRPDSPRLSVHARFNVTPCPMARCETQMSPAHADLGGAGIA
jgi:hypothetical protein